MVTSFRKWILEHFSLIPKGVWGLIIALELTDMSIYMVESIIPVYFKNLGAPTFFVGLVEGGSLFAVCLSQFISGYKSDMAQSRKKIALFGLSTSLFSRFLYAFVPTYPLLFLAKLFDRTNQGILKAPSDALIGDLADASIRGRCYGLKEAFCKVGSILGSICTSLLMILTFNNFHFVFLSALVPGILSFVIYFLFVHDPHDPEKFEEKDKKENIKKSTLSSLFSSLREFPLPFWDVIIMTFLMKLVHFGNMLFILKATELEISESHVSLIIAFLYSISGSVSYPAGYCVDRFDRKKMFITGLVFMGCSHFLVGMSKTSAVCLMGIFMWGVYQGIAQTSLASMIASASPKSLRGTGFGIFRLTIGVGSLISNLLAGVLWDCFSSDLSFFVAGLWILCLVLFLLRNHKSSFFIFKD